MADGVYVTEQVAVPMLPERMQLPLNEPELLEDRAKVPVGVITVPGEVSATVTLQVEGVSTVTGLVQVTLTETSRKPTRITKDDGVLLV